jgi:hypothetical protein
MSDFDNIIDDWDTLPYLIYDEDGEVESIGNASVGVIYHFYDEAMLFSFCPGDTCDDDGDQEEWRHVVLVYNPGYDGSGEFTCDEEEDA